MAYIHRKVGISTCGSRPLLPATFDEYATAGIEAAEISLSHDQYHQIEFDTVKRYAADAGVELWSLHLPFSRTTNIACFDEEARQKTIAWDSELIQKAAAIGIRHIVLHPSSEPITENERARSMELSKQALVKLADVAARAGAVLAVENLPRTCLGRTALDILELLEADSRLRVCFDLNHLLIEKHAPFIHAVGDKIVTLHVSDYDFVNERHWLPGEGSINWVEVMDLLDGIHYRGPFMYELGPKGSPTTIIRERDLTCADFKRNAAELEQRAKLTVLGTPKPGRGMW